MMRQADNRKVPDGLYAILTSKELTDDAKVFIADFRDTNALQHIKTGAFLGLGRDGSIRLCRKPASLIDGIWYAEVDENLAKSLKNLDLEPSDLTFEII